MNIKLPSKSRLFSDIFTKYGFIEQDFMLEKDDPEYHDFMADAKKLFIGIKYVGNGSAGYPEIRMTGPYTCLKNFLLQWYGDEWYEDELMDDFEIIR